MRVKKMGVVYEPENRSVHVVREMAVNYSGDFTTSDSVVRVMNDLFMADRLSDERVWIIGMDVRHHCRGIFEVSHGSASETMFPIREMIRDLMLIDAASVIVVHNHPSGRPDPSEQDISSTINFSAACRLMGIQLSDHVIIGSDCEFYSFLSAVKDKNSSERILS